MNGFDVAIEYSEKVKMASLEVWPGNLVKVIVPVGFNEAEIGKIISKKTKWIIEKQRLIQDIPAWREREFVSGESFPLLGREYRIKVIQAYGDTCLKDDRFIVPVTIQDEDASELVRLSLVKWYKQYAMEKIAERAVFYSDKIGVEPTKISIKDYEGRWGSCTPQGELIFNWQILCLNRSLFDFVIAHEVCHIKELNHGREFKKLLAKVIPDSVEREHQLKYQKNVF